VPGAVVELRDQALYKEDWLGLKAELETASPSKLKCNRSRAGNTVPFSFRTCLLGLKDLAFHEENGTSVLLGRTMLTVWTGTLCANTWVDQDWDSM
jgi:hypothetical protein